MSKYLKNSLADYSDGDRKAIENASFIRMDTSRTIGGDKDFDNAVSHLEAYDKVWKKNNGKRSRFIKHKGFIKHCLTFIMSPSRKRYFSVLTGNQKGGCHTYLSVAYTLDLMENIGWINRVPYEIVVACCDDKGPRSRIEVLDKAPKLSKVFKVKQVGKVASNVEVRRITVRDKSEAYSGGTYTKADEVEDEELLKQYNQLMNDTVIRDVNGNQNPWLYPLRRTVNLKDYTKKNGKKIKGSSNGRFWGPKYLTMSEEKRLQHTFDGQPIAEVDIHRCFPQFAFHMNNIPVPNLDNLYDIPDDIQKSTNVQSSLIKRNKKEIPKSIFMGAFNGNRKQDWKGSLRKQWGITSEQAERLVPRFNMINNLLFNRSIGHELMFMESQIVKHVLQQATKELIPVIPIHDSFMVPEGREAWVIACINNAYHKQFQTPTISKTVDINGRKYFHNQVQVTITYSDGSKLFFPKPIT